MKKLYFSLAITFLIVFDLIGQINFQIVVKKPVPYKLYRLIDDPTIVHLVLQNTTSETYERFIVSFTIKDDKGKLIGYTKNSHPRMNKFTIGPFQTMMINGKQALDPEAIGYDQNIVSSIITSNTLPEGNYQLCVKLLSQDGNDIGNGEKCEWISILHPQPPTLVSPANNSKLTNLLPQFLWTPVVGADPAIQIEYRLKVVKLFQGQTPKAGIESNTPILDRTVRTTYYQYLPSDLNLGNYVDVYGFAWQVQALDALTKQPAAGKDGKSEIWSFYLPEEEKDNLKLLYPADNSNFTASGGFFKFGWDASEVKKQFQSFGIKIVELNDGQAPLGAINSNNPVLNKQDINKFSIEYLLKESDNILRDGKKYAWQMYALDPQQGGVVASSQIWTFTVRSDFVEKIHLVTPDNNSILELDPLKNVYKFEWDATKVKKSISSFSIKIVPLEQGQDPAKAIKDNQPVYLENKIPASVSNHMIDKNQGVFANRLYAWQVSAISSSYNDQKVAESEVWVFSVIDAPVNLENVKLFIINDYIVNVKNVTNNNSNNFSGNGDVLLWNEGPKIDIEFNGLQLINVGSNQNPIYRVARGQINKIINNLSVSLNYNDPKIPPNPPKGSKYAKSTATMNISGLKFNEKSNLVTGIIKLKTPFIDKNNNNNLEFETTERLFKVHPVNRIDSGSANLKNPINATLLDPLNFVYSADQSSEFIVSKNTLSIKLNGEVTLPNNVKDRDGNIIKVEFKDVGGFKFDVDLKNRLLYVKVNPDMWIKFELVDLDLYRGSFYLKEGFIAFDQVKSGGLNSITLDTNDSTYLDSKGLSCKIIENGATSKTGNFRGFEFKVKNFTLIVISNNFLSSSNLTGDIKIPFINQNAKFELQISSSGLSNGIVDVKDISDEWINIYTDEEDGTKINVKAKGIAYNSNDNKFNMNMNLKFENKPNVGILIDDIELTNVSIDSTGDVRIFGSDELGVKALNEAKSGKYNGFPITIDKIKMIGKNIYIVGVKGTIVLTDDLSNDNGTPFVADAEIPKSSGGGGKDALFEAPPAKKIKVDEIPIKFKNNTSNFDAKVKWFNNDPVYGKGFLSEMKLNMKNPGKFTVESKILIGKTDNGNGFAYWFVEAGVELPKAIPTPILDIGIMGFKGRVYSKMKHSGKGITSSDYVPDANNKFGVYAKVPITSVTDFGRKFWGYTDLEIMVGDGFTGVLHGELHIFSSGYNKKDGKVKGNGTITVSTNPSLFDTEVNVQVNLWNALCGNGKFHARIDDKQWFVKVGSREKPNHLKVLCKDILTYKNYLEIYPEFTTLGIMYDFDTGQQNWGEIFGCWGRAWGNITFIGNMTYQNFNVNAKATLEGHANIGVFIDLAVWSGYKTLLEGNVQANLEANFPNPMCMAGSVYAELCFDPCPIFSCDICASATFRMRYKNGEFALQSSCEN
ncbi:MAG: hypothetical protein N2319_05080 [Candidatus Kapabacteria bacterium]|nr:hypothetical protein [Candidatus Kapabacteria bacterium]